MPKTLLNEAAKLKKASSFNFSLPYDFELPITNRPKSTVIKFIMKMTINYFVLSRSTKDELSIAESLCCSFSDLTLLINYGS